VCDIVVKSSRSLSHLLMSSFWHMRSVRQTRQSDTLITALHSPADGEENMIASGEHFPCSLLSQILIISLWIIMLLTICDIFRPILNCC